MTCLEQDGLDIVAVVLVWHELSFADPLRW
jgi:hypothetical protein